MPDENREAKLSCLRHLCSGVGHHAELPVDPSCAGLLLLARVFQPSGCGRGDPLTSRRAVCVGPGLAKIVVECQRLEPRSSTTLSSIVPARARLLTMKVAPRSEVIRDTNGADTINSLRGNDDGRGRGGPNRELRDGMIVPLSMICARSQAVGGRGSAKGPWSYSSFSISSFTGLRSQ